MKEFSRVVISGLHLLAGEVARFLDTDLDVVVGLFDTLGEAEFRLIGDLLGTLAGRVGDDVIFDEV